jgi:hypothetical protein
LTAGRQPRPAFPMRAFLDSAVAIAVIVVTVAVILWLMRRH